MLNLSDADQNKISKASSKHNYVLISPDGIIFEHHAINVFAKKLNLSAVILYKMVGKGKIMPSKYGKPSKERENTNGWSVEILLEAREL